MLVGSFERTIDPKGRIILPREMRREFEGGLMVTKGLDNCLFLFPMKEWEKLVERIDEMPSGSESTRRFTRLFFANASHLVPDGQGRVLIPPRLREMVGLQKEVVVVGLASKAEVWNPEAWQLYQEQSAKHYEQSAADIGY
ncbi:MAG: division/cell wall cluster transcriptional repressor MraZ [Actinomycetota bacterium]